MKKYVCSDYNNLDIQYCQEERKKMKEFTTIQNDEKSFSQPVLLGDMRTQMVQRGEYRTMHDGFLYYMTPFTGLVTEVRILDNSPRKARIVIELQDGKKLAFFSCIDEHMKENAVIEAIGICFREDTGFYKFYCRGGYRRIWTNEELYQLNKGKSIEELEITRIPWDIISSIKESEKINQTFNK